MWIKNRNRDRRCEGSESVQYHHTLENIGLGIAYTTQRWRFFGSAETADGFCIVLYCVVFLDTRWEGEQSLGNCKG